jgi:hypothetical protein
VFSTTSRGSLSLFVDHEAMEPRPSLMERHVMVGQTPHASLVVGASTWLDNEGVDI